MHKYVFLFVCFMCFRLGTSLKCYNCQSSPTHDCNDKTKLSVAECEPLRDAYPPVCIRKILISSLGQNMTLQCVNQQTLLECDPPNNNYTVAYCNMCKQDLCNSNDNPQENLILLAFLGFSAIYFGSKHFD